MSVCVLPKAEFCIKTIDSNGKKVFINVCSSPHVLGTTLHSEGQNVRVPMSIGPLVADTDKHNAECSSVDIIVHPSNVLKNLVEVFIQAVSVKYELELIYKSIPKMEYKGLVVREQMVRAISTPELLIQEVTHHTKETPNIIEEPVDSQVQIGLEYQLNNTRWIDGLLNEIPFGANIRISLFKPSKVQISGERLVYSQNDATTCVWFPFEIDPTTCKVKLIGECTLIMIKPSS